jgi:hypothetical protein
VSAGTKAAVKDLELDYEYLKREAGKVGQDRAVFGRQEVLINIFEQ